MTDKEYEHALDVLEKGIRADERSKTIDEYKNNVLNEFCTYCNQEACEGGCMGSIQECAEARLLRDVMEDIAKEMKEGAK